MAGGLAELGEIASVHLLFELSNTRRRLAKYSAAVRWKTMPLLSFGQ